jgi:hypothetical protein
MNLFIYIGIINKRPLLKSRFLLAFPGPVQLFSENDVILHLNAKLRRSTFSLQAHIPAHSIGLLKRLSLYQQ